MKKEYGLRFRVVLPLLVAMSLVTFIVTPAPNASAAAHTFTVTYNGNGNSGGSVPTDSTSYASGATVIVAGQNGLSRTGYTFGGWGSGGSMGPGTTYQPGQTFTISGSTTLTAVWNLNPTTYTVIFMPNGGTGSMANQSASTPTNLTLNTFTRTGYTFTSWKELSDGSCCTNYLNGGNYGFGSNITFYAQWAVNSTFTVTYNGNGQTGGTAPTDSTAYASGATVAVAGQNGLSRTGYTFGGWGSGGGVGPSTTYQPGQTFTISGNTTLTAVWNLNATYTVTFMPNGGTGSMATQSASTPTNLTLNTFTRTGFTFTSWNTDPSGGSMGISYLNGASYGFGANITLYAQWSANPTYSVTYLGTGRTSGTPPTDLSSPYSSGATVTVLGKNTLIKTGYTFTGWKDLGTGVLLGATFIIVTSMDLEPVWTMNSTLYNVYFKPNGGTPALAPIQYSNIPAALNANIFTQTGYTFINWNSAANGSGTPYANGATYAFNAYLILYAQWTPKTSTNYTITYLGNTHSGGLAPSPTTGSGSVTLATNSGSLIKSGYTFTGWNTTSNGSGTPHAVGSNYTLTADITLYAQWNTVNKTYTVTYLGNGNTGGSVPVDSTLYTANSSVTVLQLGSLVKSGFTFGGWAYGGLAIYQPGQAFSILSNTTLTAIWNPIAVYTITYLGNGNSGGSAPAPTTGTGLVTLATNSGVLVKSGSTFGGWNTAADGSGTAHAVGSNYTLIADITLYAIWSAGSKSYTIIYLGNGNSGGLAPVPTTGSGPVALATNSGGLLKTNNTFGGWNTVAGGSGTTYAVGSNYLLNANIILYAIFTPIILPPPIPEIPPGEITSIVVSVVDLNGNPIVVVIGKPTKDVPVTFVGNSIKITPPNDFSGKIVVPVKATDIRGTTTVKDIEVAVNPKHISNGKLAVTAPPKKIALNQIVPVQQKFTTVLPVNAIGFTLFVNDLFAISRNSNSAIIKQIVGPRDRSAVIALGNDGTKSYPSPVLLSQNPISLANINFSSDSYQLTAQTRGLLDKVAVIVIKHGFTKVDLIGYVDSQGSKASWITLSNNRAKMVKSYMMGKLKGHGVVITNAGRAQTEAVGSNNSATGRALNRRVEIRVS